MTQLSPLERISERRQIVDVPVPQILEEPVVPQFQGETVVVIQLSPPDRISERIIEGAESSDEDSASDEEFLGDRLEREHLADPEWQALMR